MSFTTRKFLLAVVLIILIAFTVSNRQSYFDQQSINKAVIAITPTAIPDFTTDWKTYTSNKYSFSFQVPSTFQTPQSDADYGKVGDKIWISISKHNPLECRGDCPVSGKAESIVINGINGLKESGYVGEIGGCVAQDFISYIFPKDNVYISLTQNAAKCDDWELGRKGRLEIQDRDLEVFDRIISTFQFTN